MLSVPATPYSSPSAVRKIDDAIRLIVTYLNAASTCALVRCSAINTNDATSITSNHTYRLKRSPVRKAPATPINRIWISGW